MSTNIPFISFLIVQYKHHWGQLRPDMPEDGDQINHSLFQDTNPSSAWNKTKKPQSGHTPPLLRLYQDIPLAHELDMLNQICTYTQIKNVKHVESVELLLYNSS